MKKIIIIEGCDGVGKTTLIETMAKKIDGSLIIKNTTKPNDGSPYERKKIKKRYCEILNLIKNCDNNTTVILDRYFPSEVVYSIKRGYDAFEDDWYKVFEEKLLEEKCIYVYLTRDFSEIKKIFKKRGEEYLKKEEIKTILERYDEFFERTKLRKIKVTLKKGVYTYGKCE